MTTFRATFLPAGEGDATLVEWGDHRMLIDMGTRRAGASVADQVTAGGTHVDVLVVTHVDTDHIGGVLARTVDEHALSIADVWFNGYDHLFGRSVPESTHGIEHQGPSHGEVLGHFLRGRRWNGAFHGAPIQLTAPLQEVDLHGLRVTVLGPPPERLSALRAPWEREVERAAAGEAEPAPPAGFEAFGGDWSLDELRNLADEPSASDMSVTNGTSICLLLEHDGRSMLLTGDALGTDVTHGLDQLALARPDLLVGSRVRIDLIKAPHHGSGANLPQALVARVLASNWVFSSNGARYGHPQNAAVARVLLGHPKDERPTSLGFNVVSGVNSVWGSERLKERFQYDTSYGDQTTGLTIEL